MGEKFDAARYQALALQRVREIEGRGKRALVVGGTGLYVRALTHGLSDLPEGNPELRRELDTLSLAQLQEKYAVMDPRGITRIDRQNRRRLVRAIEVTMLAGKPFSSLREDWSGEAKQGTAWGVALERDREELYGRIDARVRRMFEGGVIEEVREAGRGRPDGGAGDRVCGNQGTFARGNERGGMRGGDSAEDAAVRKTSVDVAAP